MSEGGGVSPTQEAETTLSESASSVSSHSDRNRTGVDRTANTSTSDVMDLGKLIKKPKTTSKAWKYFKVYERDHSRVRCCLEGCKKPDLRISDSSTGHLTRHLEVHHRDFVKETKESEIRQYLDKNDTDAAMNVSGSKRTMDDHVTRHHAPNFLTYAVMWIAMTYQPLCTMVDFFFRRMCQALNPKAGKEIEIGKDGLKTAILNQAAEVKVLLERFLKGQWFALTLDGWTSIQGISYLGVTIHWISDSWTICSCALGCFAKSGRSAAVDYLNELNRVLEKYGLDFTTFVAAVTDTEATMNLFGKLLVQESLQRGGGLFWNGCVAHILELTTGIAFSDTPLSQETMKKCRALVGFFNGSSNATAALLLIQTSLNIRALQVIADVATRWWSTWMMCQRLIYLRPYMNIMVTNGHLSATTMLTDPQWSIVQDIVHLLEPFMVVQKQLEGEKYVTISLVPYLIWKVVLVI